MQGGAERVLVNALQQQPGYDSAAGTSQAGTVNSG
jgi:hypothetical protein